ncbi:MAG: aminotransferase class V-fold PLP-dependent enzyme [bacterium]|nr:aminotransferase class V-fold PLP-dependent enzyme [bacterium]
MPDRRSALEPTPEEMREMTRLATDRIVAHIESLPSLPSLETAGGRELAASLVEDAPEFGTSPRELLELIFERVTPTSFTNPGPGFMAYIPGGGLFESALADFIAGGINRYVTVWAAAPGLVQLEVNVINWFCRMLGYAECAGGFLSSGGSLANFSAIFTARRERLSEDFLDGTIYVSNQIHHSVRRAATLAGFPTSAVRDVAVDEDRRIKVRDLEELISADRTRGRKPFLVVGSVGTTNTGAVDDLEALADIAERERLWLHLDAAYGGFFALTERGRRSMAGIERADSITLDPHKGLFLPYGTGCLLVRDVATLRRAHTVQADYMPPMQDSDELVDFCEISPELSRDYRGLRIWLPLKIHGLESFRKALDEKLDLTQWAYGELQTIEGIEIVAAPQLSVVAFRLAPSNLEEEDLDRLNRELIRRINDRKRVFLTGTLLDGRFVIRICVLSFRTHRDRMEMCLDDIRNSVSELLAENKLPSRSIG